MREISADGLRGLAIDIGAELQALRKVRADIEFVQQVIAAEPQHSRLFVENLGLKLHNFYTGCERIFRTIVAELDGSVPEAFDWHRRLLERMGSSRQDRPAVLRVETVDALREYLAFRHVVRNIYGYELDGERVRQLVTRYPDVWQQLEYDIEQFIAWLLALASRLTDD